MLYLPPTFEPLTDEPWEDDRARAAIREIVADADEAFEDDALWPAHEWDGWQAALPLKNLYVGAAGVIWALDRLRRGGFAETEIDLAAAARRALELWRGEPDLMRGEEHPPEAASSLFAGESGILLVLHGIAPSAEVADALISRVRENVANRANEVMWGAPGTMLAARAMLDRTGDERWAEAWRESAEELWARREADGLWTQRLWGGDVRGLGPAHGLVGNVAALLGGRELFPVERRDVLLRDTAALLAREAVVEDGLANWPVDAGGSLVGEDGEIRLQWCYGGAGIVATAAPYLDEELLLAGAELLWRAGPMGMEKGSSICHGTAGNGYALLKVFARTGDERWLERARRFAVHALGQVERARTERGRGRYSLWTGDVGVALYAAACLDVRADYPILDCYSA